MNDVTTGGEGTDADYLREMLEAQIAAGYDDFDDILENAIGCAGDEDLGLDEARIRAIVIEELRARAALEATWPNPTDNDRLQTAFAKLEAAGIVCRENFTCCQSCGSLEIWDEIREAQEEGRTVRGYAFFHQQDSERAGEGGGLMLAFGAATERSDPTAAEDIAREIASAVREEGLVVEWNGSCATRINVPIEWRRRRAAMDAAVLAA